MTAQVEQLAFDSAFWEKKIGRAGPPAESADQAARELGLDCLFLLVPIEQIAEGSAAARLGFRLCDVRVEFRARSLDGNILGPHARPFEPADLEPVAALARSSFRRTRFYNDPRFPDEGCGFLYETWARSACAGGADVLVAERGGEPAGFVTLSGGTIGLIAVAEGFRRQGAGGELMAGALALAAEQGFAEVSVATQGGNLAAQRLFQAWGGRSSSCALWWHKWYS